MKNFYKLFSLGTFCCSLVCFSQLSMAGTVLSENWALRESENMKAHLLRVRQEGKCKWMDDATQRADGPSFKDAVWKIIPQLYADAKQRKGFFAGVTNQDLSSIFNPLDFGDVKTVKRFNDAEMNYLVLANLIWLKMHGDIIRTSSERLLYYLKRNCTEDLESNNHIKTRRENSEEALNFSDKELLEMCKKKIPGWLELNRMQQAFESTGKLSDKERSEILSGRDFLFAAEREMKELKYMDKIKEEIDKNGCIDILADILVLHYNDSKLAERIYKAAEDIKKYVTQLGLFGSDHEVAHIQNHATGKYVEIKYQESAVNPAVKLWKKIGDEKNEYIGSDGKKYVFDEYMKLLSKKDGYRLDFGIDSSVVINGDHLVINLATDEDVERIAKRFSAGEFEEMRSWQIDGFDTKRFENFFKEIVDIIERSDAYYNISEIILNGTLVETSDELPDVLNFECFISSIPMTVHHLVCKGDWDHKSITRFIESRGLARELASFSSFEFLVKHDKLYADRFFKLIHSSYYDVFTMRAPTMRLPYGISLTCDIDFDIVKGNYREKVKELLNYLPDISLSYYDSQGELKKVS